MPKKYWLVTTQSKHKTPQGELDISTFSETTDLFPIEVLAASRERQPDRYWSLIFAMPITATQAKKFGPPGNA